MSEASKKDDLYNPRVLSEEEIEMYLKGDRREVDRLILYSLNRLAACIIPHAAKEDLRDAEYDRVMVGLGGLKTMLKRAEYVDTLIEQKTAKTLMMRKVSQSAITWALLAYFGFLATTTWEAVAHAIRAKVGGG